MEVRLDPDLQEYVDHPPTRAEVAANKINRSAMELRIVSALVRQSLTDSEIIEWFRTHPLPKHQEERSQSESWLRSLIRTARATKANKPEPDGQQQEQQQRDIRVIEIDQYPAFRKRRSYRDPGLAYLVLTDLREREERGEAAPTLTEWRHQIIEVSGRSALTLPVKFKTAQRLSDALVEGEYVEKRPVDGRTWSAVLTQKGRRMSFPAMGKWGRWVRLPGRRAVAELEDETPPPVEEQEDAPAPTLRQRRKRRSEREIRINRHRRRHSLNGHYWFWFGGNKIRYIQLLSEWFDGEFWPRLVVSYDPDGLARIATAMPDDDDDPLYEVVPWEPRGRSLAAAVELVRDGDSFRVAEHIDEEGVVAPSVGVVMEAWYPFARVIQARDLDHRIIRVVGSGKNDPKNKVWRRYTFEDAGPPIPIEASVDLHAVAESMDEAKERILQVPRGWFAMPPARQALVQKLLTDPA